MVLVAPSLLSANPAFFGREIKRLEKAHADLLHFDVMDGHFVPNMTYGPHILKGLKKITYLPFDVHLMVNNPEKFVPWFAEAKADIITFHLEATSQPDKLLKEIKKHHIKAGISLRPKTDISLLSTLHELPDLVLVMGVEPGFGGQSFLKDTPRRIKLIKKIFAAHHVLIEVDGGIDAKTASLCIEAGADILAAGTAVFRDGCYAKNIRRLRGEK